MTEEKIKVNIDGIDLEVNKGTSILEAAKSVGIKIPTLCEHEDLRESGTCRICVVEVEGERLLAASCSYPITRSINIKTYSPKVRRARQNILHLLLRNHYGECYSCYRNNNCELQNLAAEYGIDSYKFGHITSPRYTKDESSYAIIRDMDKCILCRRCVRTCQDLQGVAVLDVINRGSKTQISTYLDKPINDLTCINCGQCINRCPTAALRENSKINEIWEAIDSPNKHVIIQTAPSPRAAIGEEFGLEPGTSVTKKLNTALKRIGFDKVFDTNFTADLTIMEEGTELLLRLKKVIVEKDTNVKLPQLTSCSPGWIKFIEHFYPEKLDHLSTAKSPQQMFGAVIKTWYALKNNIPKENIVSVSLMPCTAKKYECEREEMNSSGLKDVDYVITTRELARMIKQCGIDLAKLPESEFDSPLGIGSGAGLIFGATGGVMEAAIRTVYEIVTGRPVPFEKLNVLPVRGMKGIKEAEILLKDTLPEWNFLEGVSLKVLIAHGTKNAKKVMDMLVEGKLADYHFIEIMACPGGCLGGGGQPIPTNEKIRTKRAQAIYNEDQSLTLRESHKNPIVKQIYEEFLKEPCGHLSHKLLHTSYKKRGKVIK